MTNGRNWRTFSLTSLPNCGVFPEVRLSPSTTVNGRPLKPWRESGNSLAESEKRSERQKLGQLRKLTKSWKEEQRACPWCQRPRLFDGTHELVERGDGTTKQTRLFVTCKYRAYGLRGPFE